MRDHTKSERKQLAALNALAYERELRAAIDNLLKRAEDWRRGDIDTFEMNAAIHEYHQHHARELWKTYDMNRNYDIPVTSALVRGVLTEDDIPETLREHILNLADYMRPPKDGDA